MGLVFLTNKSGVHSAVTHGEQVAKALGARIDIPRTEISRDDTVVMVKYIDRKIFKITNKIFCDIGDAYIGHKLLKLLLEFPGIGIIIQTPTAVDLVKKIFPKSPVTWIPCGHCNHENRPRPSRPVKTVLFNGRKEGFEKLYWKGFASLMKKEGFDTIRCCTGTREDSCAVYMEADINVSFRIDFPLHKQVMKGPLKIHNAGSFGIPTIAYPEIGYVESYGDPNCFIHIKSPGEMMEQCKYLRDKPEIYEKYANLARVDSEKSHILEVVRRYKELLEWNCFPER